MSDFQPQSLKPQWAAWRADKTLHTIFSSFRLSRFLGPQNSKNDPALTEKMLAVLGWQIPKLFICQIIKKKWIQILLFGHFAVWLLIFVVLVTMATILIKIVIEFPGLLRLKCVYNEGSEEDTSEDVEKVSNMWQTGMFSQLWSPECEDNFSHWRT